MWGLLCSIYRAVRAVVAVIETAVAFYTTVTQVRASFA